MWARNCNTIDTTEFPIYLNYSIFVQIVEIIYRDSWSPLFLESQNNTRLAHASLAPGCSLYRKKKSNPQIFYDGKNRGKNCPPVIHENSTDWKTALTYTLSMALLFIVERKEYSTIYRPYNWTAYL